MLLGDDWENDIQINWLEKFIVYSAANFLLA